MKKLALVCGILASVVVSISVGVWAMSGNELDRARDNCFNSFMSGETDESACKAFLMNALPNVEQCYGEGVSCFFDTFPSVEQCDKNTCFVMAMFYLGAERYKEAIPYLKKAAALGDDYAAPFLATIYGNLRDYPNAKKYYEIACNNLGVLYGRGEGVRQDKSIAKEYYGKACDLRSQEGCDNYRTLNERGVE